MRISRLSRGLAAGFLLMTLTGLSACQSQQGGEAVADAADAAADAQVMLDHLAAQARTLQEKLEGLAEAIPEESYGWRPMEGVRSVAEVFAHVAADNYLLPAALGVAAPEGTGITTDYTTAQAYEARERSKEELIAGLTASFDHLFAAMEATRGELDASVTVFGSEFTGGGLWTMTVTHLHEHLGQMIAYARSNSVVPPWSM